MNPFYSQSGHEIHHGDCIEICRQFVADRFSTVITDPPYHLTTGKKGGSGPASLNTKSPAGRSRISTGFMGKAWDGGDVAFRPETWAEVLRVCKPGAMLLAFGGSRTFHRLTCAIEDGGWEIRDCMSWLYGSGFPKSLDISKAIDKAAGAEREVLGQKSGDPLRFKKFKEQDGNERQTFGNALTAPATAAAQQWDGWGTALKPAWEPIIVAMKPLDGTFAENALQHGVAGLNIDGGRINPGEIVPGGGNGKAHNGGMFGAHKTSGLRPLVESHSDGRFPANVLLDEVATAMLDQQTGTLESGKPTGIKAGGKLNCYGTFAGGIPVTGYGDAGGASRFFYTAKASKSDRGADNDHATVKPLALMKYLCTLTATPTGGEILDPFGGSMTTLVAARECGRPAVAIELIEDHCKIGVKRLSQGHLFSAGGAA